MEPHFKEIEALLNPEPQEEDNEAEPNQTAGDEETPPEGERVEDPEPPDTSFINGKISLRNWSLVDTSC